MLASEEYVTFDLQSGVVLFGLFDQAPGILHRLGPRAAKIV
jgi:hypothetical protein